MLQNRKLNLFQTCRSSDQLFTFFAYFFDWKVVIFPKAAYTVHNPILGMKLQNEDIDITVKNIFYNTSQGY